MSIISGAEFNKLFGGVNLYKFTNSTHLHHNFQYKEGLNVDIIPLTTKPCSAGGLYFTTHNEKFHRWIDIWKVWVWDVVIPDDAKVTIESISKAKADKIIISNKRKINEMKEWNIEKIALDTVSICPSNIKHINNPSEAVQLSAVTEHGFAIDHIKNPNEALQLIAVQQNGWNIKHIKNPSEAVQLAAVQQKGSAKAIRYIKDPSEKIKLAAVQHDGCAIKYITNPSEAVKLAAVQQRGWSIRYIKIPVFGFN